MSSQDDFGCLDGACPFHSRFGMHTNGGCNCVYDAFPDIEQRRLVERMLRRARDVALEDGKKLGMRDAPAVAKAVQGFLAAVLDLPKREARRVVESELRRLQDLEDAASRPVVGAQCCPKCFAPAEPPAYAGRMWFSCDTYVTHDALVRDPKCHAAEAAFWRGARTQPDAGTVELSKGLLEVLTAYGVKTRDELLSSPARPEFASTIGSGLVDMLAAWWDGKPH